MPDKTIYRGLMGAATQTPTDPAARLRALQQRMQTRRQVTGQPTPPRINPRPGMPPRPGQATSQNPGGIMPPHMQQPGNTGVVPPHMQPQRPFNSPVAMPPQAGVPATPSGVPAAASMQAMPQRPQGMPPAPSGINPTVPGVTMPDSARAPRMTIAAAPRPIGGLMAPTPYEQS